VAGVALAVLLIGNGIRGVVSSLKGTFSGIFSATKLSMLGLALAPLIRATPISWGTVALGLEHELKSLNLMFSMQDIVKLMGPNSASFIQMSDQLGTLEPGKLADLVLLDGNPLDGYWNMLKTKVVLKGGVVVVDKR